MSELSERARKLADELVCSPLPCEFADNEGLGFYGSQCIHCEARLGHKGDEDECAERSAKLIEQVLLSERKSVWEEAAKIAEEFNDGEHTDECNHACHNESAIAKSIRLVAGREESCQK